MHGHDIWFIFGVLILVCAAVVFIPQKYRQTVIPGVWVGSVPVGGQKISAAEDIIQKQINRISEAGLRVTIDGKTKAVPVQQALTSSDAAPPLVDIDAAASAQAAFSYGHKNGFVRNTLEAWRAIIFRKHVDPNLEMNVDQTTNALQQSFGAKDTPAQDAHMVYSNGNFSSTTDKKGYGFQYDIAALEARTQWKRLEVATVTLTQGDAEAKVKVSDVEKKFDEAREVIKRAPFTLTVDGTDPVTLNADTVGSGLDVVSSKKGKFELAFTEAKLAKIISSIQKDVNVEAKDARFTISQGKVSEFQAGQIGRKLNVASTVAAMNIQLLQKKQSAAVAVVEVVTPQSASASAENLGITELVATGKTNFKGSPTNRRKNIANAVRLLNGLLIKPGEEFSLVTALKPIELSNGYLPELVIKGNRTIPEVGGGLCQVGTTMFRLALDAGVPILERRNHSYRVSYYEPPVGMDATIYDPKPDFRIKNDYVSALLLQARVSGDNLIFDFYGTKDGRVATTTKPILSNVTKPPATKYIKTTELPVGQKKRLEHAHNGGSATFTYTVVKDGKTTNQVFNSKYKAWQEVWLVGATAEDVAADAAGA